MTVAVFLSKGMHTLWVQCMGTCLCVRVNARMNKRRHVCIPPSAPRSSRFLGPHPQQTPSSRRPNRRARSGAQGDRKAMAAFRQEQQAARQKLEKAKAKWHVSLRARGREGGCSCVRAWEAW